MKFSKFAHYLIIPATAVMIVGCGATISETIGGTVTGLSGGTQLILLNNGGNPVTITANGNYTFSKQIETGGTYNVTIQSNPTGETCTVSNNSGTISSTVGTITNINVSCTAITGNYNSVSGTISGLPSGKSVILSDGGTNPSLITVSANGTFSFPTQLPVGSAYNVSVVTPPTGGSCSVTNNNGVVPQIGIPTPVVVSCN